MCQAMCWRRSTYMAGLRGAAMMQTPGFALIANALASLVVPYQVPMILLISERGTMGEFNIGQTLARGPCGRR
jgi:sulfopyruvate decarboxylase TPP-binding subunit